MDHSIYSDEELALQVQSGSLTAFDELVRRHEAVIFRFLATRTPAASDAEDLVQRVFVRAYRKIQLYNKRYRFLPWLYTIARRESIQFYRSNRPSKALGDELVDDRLPSDQLEQSDAHDQLWNNIRAILPEVSATAVWLRYEEDLPIAEVATVLKRTPVHVKVLLHRARKKLAQHLDAPGSSAIQKPTTSALPSHV